MFTHISEVLESKRARLEELQEIERLEREVEKELQEEQEKDVFYSFINKRKVNHNEK